MFIAAIFVACNKDDDEPAVPNYIGTFEVSALRDDCTDPTLSGMVVREDQGVCLFVTDGQNCIDIRLELNADMTYSLTTTITEIRGSSSNTRAPSTDRGNYEVTNNQLTLNPQATDPTVMSIGNNGSTIDWVVATLNNGCERIYGFMKT